MSKLDLLLKDGKRIKDPTLMFTQFYETFKEEINSAKEWLWTVSDKNQSEIQNEQLSFETLKELLRTGSELSLHLKELDNMESQIGKIDRW